MMAVAAATAACSENEPERPVTTHSSLNEKNARVHHTDSWEQQSEMPKNTSENLTEYKKMTEEVSDHSKSQAATAESYFKD